MRIADAKAAAQVLFVDIDGTNVRFDVILLEQTIWGTQLLPAGAPISIAVDVEPADQRLAVMAMAEPWSVGLDPIELIFAEHEGRPLVIMGTGDERLMLSMAPSADSG
jgi:hypothetical protein